MELWTDQGVRDGESNWRVGSDGVSGDEGGF